jgi:hypothetical protein
MTRRQPVPDVPQPPTPDPTWPTGTDPDDPPEGTPPPPRSLLFDLSQNRLPSLPRSSPSLGGPESPSPPDEFGSPPHWTDDAPSAQPVRKAGTSATKKKKLKPLLRKAVETLGAQLHTFGTAPESPERDVGLWLADKEDQAGIGDPLTSILSRRVPNGVDNPDVTDGIDLALGLLGYVMKNLQLRAAVRVPKFETIPGEVLDPSGQSDDDAAT